MSVRRVWPGIRIGRSVQSSRIRSQSGSQVGVGRVVVKKNEVTKGHASNYVAADPSHEGTQPAWKGADRTNSILRKACHAHSVCLQVAKERL